MDLQVLIETIVEQVQRVDGVRAVVLGGSRAHGTSALKRRACPYPEC
jgi:hypothetical protein